MSSPAERVRGLIRDSGLSQHDFAVQIGLDDSKLSKSLSGARRFSSVDLARIAELCKVTVDWLITGEDTPLALAARTSGGSARTAIDVGRRLSTLRSDMAGLGYAQPWQPVTRSPGKGRSVEQGDKLAELALDRLREAGRSSTKASLPAVVEDIFGADVAIEHLGADFDGLATSSDDVKLIVLATSQVPGRQRFTLAHELGHLLAGDDQGVHLDKDIFGEAQRKEPSELRANAFAAAFLMPKAALRAAVGRSGLTQRAFAELACDLVVSPSTLAYRLLNLRLIDRGTCDRLRTMTGAKAAQVAQRGEQWVRHVAEANAPRPPGLLLRDTYAAYESGASTLRPYASLLRVGVDDLRNALEAEAGVVSA